MQSQFVLGREPPADHESRLQEARDPWDLMRLNPHLIRYCFLFYWEGKLGAASAEFSARAHILLNTDAMVGSVWFMAQAPQVEAWS